MLSSESFQASCVLFGLIGGYLAGTQPGDAGWRWFSYHPFFMTLGFVGLMGSACHKKKLGGYMNTKVSGLLRVTDDTGIIYLLYRFYHHSILFLITYFLILLEFQQNILSIDSILLGTWNPCICRSISGTRYVRN